MVGPVLVGFLAVLAMDRRPRYSRILAGVLALLTVNVLVQQITAIASASESFQAEYLLAYSLFNTAATGLLVATFLSKQRQRSRSGVVLWLTGTSVTVVTLWYLFSVSGPDGLRRDLLLVHAGAYVTLCASGLLILGGGLLVRDPSTAVHSAGAREERSTPLLESPVFGVALLATAAISGIVAGTRLEWVVVSLPRGDGLDLTAPSTGPVLGNVAAFVLVAAVLVAVVLSTRCRMRRIAASILFVCGAVVASAPLRIYFNQRDPYPGAPGLYVTVGAGVILIAAGALLSHVRWISAAEPSRKVESDTRTTASSDAIHSGAAMVAVSGTMVLLAGVWMDWFVPHPSTGATIPDPVVSAGGFGSQAVLFGLVLVGIAGSVAVTIHSRSPASGVLLFATGFVAALVCLFELVATTGTNGLTESGLLVAPGVYVTLFGAVLLAIAGTLQHTTTVVSGRRTVSGDHETCGT